MTILAIASVAIGLLAFILALIALARTVPAITWEPANAPDTFMLWNTGPNAVVICRASVWSPEISDGPVNSEPRVVMAADERLFGWKSPYAKGQRLSPHQRFAVMVPVNHDLRINYQLDGFLGFLSRSSIRIEGYT